MDKGRVGLSFVLLAGLVVLNYGFANLTFHIGGFPLPVAHLLGGAALLTLLWGRWEDLRAFLREPLTWGWLVLLGLTMAHLFWDAPRYGAWAWRDASFVLEGGFLLLGFLWAYSPEEERRFTRLLLALLPLNLLYSLTYPFRDQLAAWTEIQGAFRQVSLLGHYSNQGFWLVIGAVFCLTLAERSRGRWRLLLFLLALAQAGWSFLFQSRSAYLGMLLIVAVWAFFGGWRKGWRMGVFFAASFLAFLLVAMVFAALGRPLQGRIRPVTPGFYFRHLSSVWIAIVWPSPEEAPVQPSPEEVPALGSARWRFDVWRQALAHWLATPTTMMVGEGFGRPLIDFRLAGGVIVRQPHNTHLTVLARLGALGFLLWLAMQIRLLGLFWRSLWKRERPLLLWGLAFYLYGMLVTSVEPWLEFSYGAIPFFTVVGFLVRKMFEKARFTHKEMTLDVLQSI